MCLFHFLKSWGISTFHLLGILSFPPVYVESPGPRPIWIACGEGWRECVRPRATILLSLLILLIDPCIRNTRGTWVAWSGKRLTVVRSWVWIPPRAPCSCSLSLSQKNTWIFKKRKEKKQKKRTKSSHCQEWGLWYTPAYCLYVGINF